MVKKSKASTSNVVTGSSGSGSRQGSNESTVISPGVILCEEPITLYRLELERLQYIFHFPEEVAFQLSNAEYRLFYGVKPIDFVRYVSCDLTSVPIIDNSSPLRNLVKRFSEVIFYFNASLSYYTLIFLRLLR